MSCLLENGGLASQAPPCYRNWVPYQPSPLEWALAKALAQRGATWRPEQEELAGVRHYTREYEAMILETSGILRGIRYCQLGKRIPPGRNIAACPSDPYQRQETLDIAAWHRANGRMVQLGYTTAKLKPIGERYGVVLEGTLAHSCPLFHNAYDPLKDELWIDPGRNRALRSGTLLLSLPSLDALVNDLALSPFYT
ncbi:MAG: hypothetical protein ABSE73_02060 [Planctomycetota bacterium]